jgi:phage protein D
LGSVNDPTLGARVRQPRALVLVNGAIAAGVVSWEVDNNTHFQPDYFRVVLALSAQSSPTDWAFWASQTDLTVEILCGFPRDPEHYSRNDLQQVILGRVDDIEIDPVRDEILLVGRDYTALFIDSKNAEQFRNQSASDIVTLLARRHGMQTQSFPTATLAGKYYEIDHAKIVLEMSEWDVLTYLARKENAEVFVRGNTLVFRPRPSGPGVPYVIRWQPPAQERHPVSNAVRVSFQRNLTLAKDVVVFVRTWNQKDKEGRTVKAAATHNKSKVLRGGTALGESQIYRFTVANLTVEQAKQFAQAKLAEITQHEIRLTATLPGDNDLTMDNSIQVIGTGTAYDQTYYPNSISREFSIDEGYVMHVNAKNHSPETQTIA